jgi:ribonucleotide reductase alpha subunit
MDSVKNNLEWELVSPHTGEITNTLMARDVFDKIAHYAHSNGEPGLLFLDTANKYNPVPHLYELESTNPCVSGDTYVITYEDGLVQVKNIIGAEVNILSGGYYCPSSGFFKTGHKNILLIETKCGIAIKVTANHKISIGGNRGITGDFRYVEAKDIKIGDSIELSLNLNSNWSQYINMCEIEIADDEISTVVTKISKCPSEDVYDIKVPNMHSFDANGIRVHNCGEQWLGPYENCCLGSINLSNYYDEESWIYWTQLENDIKLATMFLDNVVEYNKYIPSVPKLRQAALKCRRIGLGIMGLADLMFKLGIGYNTEEGYLFAEYIMAYIRIKCMETSIKLAKEKGAFPAYKGSIYDDPDWHLPELSPYTNNTYIGIYEEIEKEYEQFREVHIPLMRKYGIRNAAQTTIAPTGTIATVAGCEGYGCEPVFALAYKRFVNTPDGQQELVYVSPAFKKVLEEFCNRRPYDNIFNQEKYDRILDQVLFEGSCQNVAELSDEIKRVFVVSSDITGKQHICMQAALQKFVDNSISKTCNLPFETTVEQVRDIYMQAYESGCKGITIYRAGSRNKVVLETASTASTKNKTKKTKKDINDSNDANDTNDAKFDIDVDGIEFAEDEEEVFERQQEPLDCEESEINFSDYQLNNSNHIKNRPKVLSGVTFNEQSSLGKIMICINDSDDGPFETFITSSKQGSSVMADCEAIGRIISYILRLNSNIISEYLLYDIGKQMQNIGGINKNPPSMPHAIYMAITRHLLSVNADTVPKRKYGNKVYGNTYEIKSPSGNLYVRINNDKEGYPLDVVITAAKAGSDIAAHCEALGRLISYCLRLDIPRISPNLRLLNVMKQLDKIGQGSSTGLGKNKVCSLADGVAKAISKHLEVKEYKTESLSSDNICLGCGNATMLYTEGCQTCISCGYSLC